MSKPMTIRALLIPAEPTCAHCRHGYEACHCVVECSNCGADTWANEAEPVSPHNRSLGVVCIDCVSAGARS